MLSIRPAGGSCLHCEVLIEHCPSPRTLAACLLCSFCPTVLASLLPLMPLPCAESLIVILPKWNISSLLHDFLTPVSLCLSINFSVSHSLARNYKIMCHFLYPVYHWTDSRLTSFLMELSLRM